MLPAPCKSDDLTDAYFAPELVICPAVMVDLIGPFGRPMVRVAAVMPAAYPPARRPIPAPPRRRSVSSWLR